MDHEGLDLRGLDSQGLDSQSLDSNNFNSERCGEDDELCPQMEAGRSPAYFIRRRKKAVPLILNDGLNSIGFARFEDEGVVDARRIRYFCNLDSFSKRIFPKPCKVVARNRAIREAHHIARSTKGKGDEDVPGSRMLRGNFCTMRTPYSFSSFKIPKFQKETEIPREHLLIRIFSLEVKRYVL